jgi:hypothetical protein
VFRGDLVRWDDVGTIPFDALGAPGWNPRAQAKPAASPGPGGQTSPRAARPASPGSTRPARAGAAGTAERPGHGR